MQELANRVRTIRLLPSHMSWGTIWACIILLLKTRTVQRPMSARIRTIAKIHLPTTKSNTMRGWEDYPQVIMISNICRSGATARERSSFPTI